MARDDDHKEAKLKEELKAFGKGLRNSIGDNLGILDLICIHLLKAL
ncbi:MAG TPA: hypothetical protein VD770_03935 [Coxiellaceae bacterium]|nr:hypothetical protein [Coxiellaceae bacterium]